MRERLSHKKPSKKARVVQVHTRTDISSETPSEIQNFKSIVPSVSSEPAARAKGVRIPSKNIELPIRSNQDPSKTLRAGAAHEAPCL